MISAGTPTIISIPITISTASGSVVDSYEVMWETDDIGGCSGGSDMDSTTTIDGSTDYNIMGLEEDSSYTITVTASNSAGSSEDGVTAMTLKAGERLSIHGSISMPVQLWSHIIFSLQLLLVLLLQS